MMQETTVDYIYNVCTVEEKVDNKKKELQIGANIKKNTRTQIFVCPCFTSFCFYFYPNAGQPKLPYPMLT